MQNPFINTLRNYQLALNRSKNYCKEFGVDCSKMDMQGATSALMIDLNSQLDDSNKLNRTQLQCPQRRGAEIKFVFNDKIDPPKSTFEGDYIPEYNTASKQLQDQMHIAGSLDMFSRMKDADFKLASGDPKKDPKFFDIDGDRERFKNVLKDNPGCANDKYSVDASRRLYWSVMNSLNKAKDQSSKAGAEVKAQFKQLHGVIENGDYTKMKSSPGLQKIFKEATNANSFKFQSVDVKGGNSVNAKVDMYNGFIYGSSDMTKKFENAHPELKTKADKLAYAQMVLTVRSMAIGRPVFSEYKSASDDLYHFEKGTFRGRKAPSKAFKGYVGDNGKKISRYGYAPSPMDVAAWGQVRTTLNPEPTSVFNCFDVYDAMADHITDNSADNTMLVDYLQEGQTLKMDAEHVNDISYVDILGYRTGRETRVRAQTKGWVCQACGSGVHVHDDGSVNIVSRDRNTKFASRSGANKSVISSREDGLTIGSMLNLPSYIIPNCAGCGCLKGLTGDALKAKLTDSKTTKHYMTEKTADGGLQLNQTAAKVKSSDTCVFVPPVPHSCTYRPAGESAQDNQLKEIRGKLYCDLRDKLKTKPTKEYDGKPGMYQELVDSCKEVNKKLMKNIIL